MSQRGWAPSAPVEQSRRMRMTHSYVRRGWGGHYVAVLFVLQLPLTHKPFKQSERDIFLRTVSLVFIIASICILHESASDYTTVSQLRQRLLSWVYKTRCWEGSHPSAEKQSVYSAAPPAN